jgi:hypothetical protein
VVKLACERPDVVGRSLSQWDSAELARQLVHDGVVEAISPQTVQRILASHKLKPWRHHLWLSPTVPRDAPFAAQVTEIVRVCLAKIFMIKSRDDFHFLTLSEADQLCIPVI